MHIMRRHPRLSIYDWFSKAFGTETAGGQADALILALRQNKLQALSTDPRLGLLNHTNQHIPG